MDRERRQQLESIANVHPVYVPNGEWNCQDFVKSVLDAAVDAGIIAAQDRDRVLEEGKQLLGAFRKDPHAARSNFVPDAGRRVPEAAINPPQAH